MPQEFRTCVVTGLRVHRSAERLIQVNLATAVVCLALGGLTGVLVALTRWPAVQLLVPRLYYPVLTAHGAFMLLFWVLFFEVAGLYFSSAVLLGTRLAAPRLAWTAYALMLGGALLTVYEVAAGRGTVMVTAYPPLKASAAFYLGLLVFAVGALLAVGIFLATLRQARRSGAVTGSLPLVSYAFLTAAVLAVFTILSGALALVPLLAWSLGWIGGVDPAVYRLYFWGFGHGAQQVNLAAMVGCWYALASLTLGARPVHEGLSRMAFLLYALFIQLGSVHHLLVDPGLSEAHRLMNTSYFMYLAVVGSMIHAFSIPAAVEVELRERGHARGLFGWLRAAPWSEPGFAALAWSFVLFGVVGGVTGVVMGGMQVNLLVHNTLFVPGHFHMTVASGTTLAFMGIAYYLVPLIARRQPVWPRLIRWQPHLFGLGLLLMAGGMLLAGRLGVPRRVPDISYAAATLPTDVFARPDVQAAMGLLGVGALLAAAGGAIFVATVLGTLGFGRPSDRPMRIAVPLVPAAAGGSDAPDAAGAERHADHGHGLRAPGTLALVFTFLGWFVLAFVAAHLSLARVWDVR